jgi:hypothetical protein
MIDAITFKQIYASDGVRVSCVQLLSAQSARVSKYFRVKTRLLNQLRTPYIHFRKTVGLTVGRTQVNQEGEQVVGWHLMNRLNTFVSYLK